MTMAVVVAADLRESSLCEGVTFHERGQTIEFECISQTAGTSTKIDSELPEV